LSLIRTKSSIRNLSTPSNKPDLCDRCIYKYQRQFILRKILDDRFTRFGASILYGSEELDSDKAVSGYLRKQFEPKLVGRVFSHINVGIVIVYFSIYFILLINYDYLDALSRPRMREVSNARRSSRNSYKIYTMLCSYSYNLRNCCLLYYKNVTVFSSNTATSFNIFYYLCKSAYLSCEKYTLISAFSVFILFKYSPSAYP
jgi:hypothetical protein